MPSPFPGMDPYLEDPLHWRGLQQVCIAHIWFTLSSQLPPGFSSQIQQRLYTAAPRWPNRRLVPDCPIPQRREYPSETPVGGGRETGDEPGRGRFSLEEIREDFIQIVRTKPNRHVVTTIEMLNTANKVEGRGREEYLRTRAGLLQNNVNLLEIDLLRDGDPTIIGAQKQQPGLEYGVSLRRCGTAESCETWVFGLRECLPCVPIPLEEGMPDLSLDLQAAINRIYDVGRYRGRLNYMADPPPPLTEADRQWLNDLLRGAYLRN